VGGKVSIETWMFSIQVQLHLKMYSRLATQGGKSSMKETISGTYKTTRYNEQEYSKVEHGPKLTLAEKESTFEGGIEGKGIHRNSIVYLSDGSAPFTGHVCITGRIGDREGSFVVEDYGVPNQNTFGGTWKVVDGSATGDLVGLKGEGGWKWEKGNKNVAYTLSYEL
jgi:hypothetical protein